MLRITPVSEDKVNDGVWTKYRGVDLKIARGSNEKFQKLFASLTRPHKFQMDKGTLDNDTMKSIMSESLGRTILVDWKSLVLDGKEVKYTKELSVELMDNDPDCREFVQEFSSSVDNYLSDQEEEVKGKS